MGGKTDILMTVASIIMFVILGLIFAPSINKSSGVSKVAVINGEINNIRNGAVLTMGKYNETNGCNMYQYSTEIGQASNLNTVGSTMYSKIDNIEYMLGCNGNYMRIIVSNFVGSNDYRAKVFEQQKGNLIDYSLTNTVNTQAYGTQLELDFKSF